MESPFFLHLLFQTQSNFARTLLHSVEKSWFHLLDMGERSRLLAVTGASARGLHQ